MSIRERNSLNDVRKREEACVVPQLGLTKLADTTASNLGVFREALKVPFRAIWSTKNPYRIVLADR